MRVGERIMYFHTFVLWGHRGPGQVTSENSCPRLLQDSACPLLWEFQKEIRREKLCSPDSLVLTGNRTQTLPSAEPSLGPDVETAAPSGPGLLGGPPAWAVGWAPRGVLPGSLSLGNPGPVPVPTEDRSQEIHAWVYRSQSSKDSGPLPPEEPERELGAPQFLTHSGSAGGASCRCGARDPCISATVSPWLSLWTPRNGLHTFSDRPWVVPPSEDSPVDPKHRLVENVSGTQRGWP